MKDKFFIDTNIIIYSFDINNKKNKTAKHIISNALSTNKGIISYQVIQEFLNVALQKFSVPLRIDDCKIYLNSVLMPLCEIYPDNELFLEALNIKKETGYSFYDALIISSAIKSECSILYSEDLAHKQKIKKLEIVNPFKE